MKKTFNLLCIAITALNFFSCATTSGVKSNPTEYVEYSRNEVFYEADFRRIIDTTKIKGFKVTNSQIRFELKDGFESLRVNDFYVDYVDFAIKNPDFKDRLESSKRYTVYLSYITENDSYKPVLDDIENLRTVSQIQEENKYLEEQKQKQEKADKEASEQKTAELKIKASKITDGYIYHGPEEAKENAILYKNGALEYGHAYYIESFMLKAGGELGGAATTILANPEYHYVEYANQKIRQEVTSASESILGTLPVTVIIAGGKAPMHVPVVLGLLE